MFPDEGIVFLWMSVVVEMLGRLAPASTIAVTRRTTMAVHSGGDG